MSDTKSHDLEAFREEGLSAARRAAFRAATAAEDAWNRSHPVDLEGILAFIDQLRALFGDPPVDRTPWRGSDFRL
jgi:hypothetical protein